MKRDQKRKWVTSKIQATLVNASHKQKDDEDEGDNGKKSMKQHKHNDRKRKASTTTSHRKTPPKKSSVQNKPNEKKSKTDKDEQVRTSGVARMLPKDEEEHEHEHEQKMDTMASFHTQLAALNPVLADNDARMEGKDYAIWKYWNQYRHILYVGSSRVLYVIYNCSPSLLFMLRKQICLRLHLPSQMQT